MTNLYGFTFMRGVDRLDYPYMEMLKSMSNVTKSIHVALGDSDDQTAENVSKLEYVKIINSTWEDQFHGDGGQIFSQQANLALKALRDDHHDDPDAWALFLHCDEIVHPNQYHLISQEIKKAIKLGADAVRFRFLHFWKDHYHIAINKRWHPAEIRLFKLNSKIQCYGDAQGFTGHVKQIDSDINVYHYGHVRPAEQHKLKQEEIMRRIRPAEKFNKYWRRERRAFAKTKMLPILCHHPDFMKSRIERLDDPFFLPEREQVHIVGKRENYSSSFLESINVKDVFWHKGVDEVPKKQRAKNMVIVKPTLLQRFLYNQTNSVQMESPLASPWNNEMELLFRLSAKDFSLKG